MTVAEPTTGTPVVAEIDFEAPGKHFGRLLVPVSDNLAGWANIVIPIVTVVGCPGPTAVIFGAVHGDEAAGQISALRLIRDVQPDDVTGRLIIVPCTSPDAARAYTRLWPSGANLNRSFPGSPDGTPDEQLADYFSRFLFPMSNVVIDMHSGSKTNLCLPWSEMHLVPDREQRRAMIDAMLAWNSDFHFVYIDIAGSGLLVREAERQGKIVVSTELGGGGQVTAEVLRIGYQGLTNVLRHVKILTGKKKSRPADRPAIILQATERENYTQAPESGVFEALVDLGDRVEEKQVIGLISFIERPDRAPEPIVAGTSGIVCSVRGVPATRAGDNVFVVAHEVDRDSLEREAVS